ncbi:MAG: caspase family protein [Planctomycetes bacterium]|nr:caspase family protein [Planctomycetota bacterium]
MASWQRLNSFGILALLCFASCASYKQDARINDEDLWTLRQGAEECTFKVGIAPLVDMVDRRTNDLPNKTNYSPMIDEGKFREWFLSVIDWTDTTKYPTDFRLSLLGDEEEAPASDDEAEAESEVDEAVRRTSGKLFSEAVFIDSALYSGQGELQTESEDESVISRFPAPVTPSEEFYDDVIRIGYERNLDAVIFLTLKVNQAKFIEFNGNYWWSLLAWLSSIWGSGYVADETYRVDMELRVKVVSVHGGHPTLFDETFTVGEGLEQNLDDWPHGFMFFGLFNTPEAINEQGWQGVYSEISSFTCRELERQMLAKLSGVFRGDTHFRRQRGNSIGEMESVSAVHLGTGGEAAQAEILDELNTTTSKTLALLIGANQISDGRLTSATNALIDTANFATLLLDSEHGRGMNSRYLYRLEGAQATSAAVNSTIDEIRQRARSEDTIIVYFSGMGTFAKPSSDAKVYAPHLLTFDSISERVPATSISLVSLANSISQIDAAHKILILDTSFNGTTKGRCATSEVLAEGIEDDASFDGPEAQDVTIIISSAGSQDALTIDDLGGLFTYAMILGTESDASGAVKADNDNDGVVILGELFEFAKKMVYEQSLFEPGDPQTPLYLEALPRTRMLPFWTGSR